jgi:hypothetical protein
VREKEKRVQDLIPVKHIYNQMIETIDQRLIKILSVTSINMYLMSFEEEKEILGGYEVFLKSLDKPIQIARVSQTIDLKKYILGLKKEFDSIKNPYKQEMLNSYIYYAKSLQENRDLIRRHCYVIIDQPFTNSKSKERAEKQIFLRAQDLKRSIEGISVRHKLEVAILTNEEMRKCLHLFFDYEQAQLESIPDMKELAYQIGSNNLMQVARFLMKEQEGYLSGGSEEKKIGKSK